MPPAKHIEPKLGAESFSCPHCGAIAQQTWYRLFLDNIERLTKPEIVGFDAGTYMRLKTLTFQNAPAKEKDRERTAEFYERLAKHLLTYRTNPSVTTTNAELVNTFVSHCFSCEGFSIWIGNGLLYPAKNTAYIPHEEMPEAIRGDFQEAAAIVDKSARGAAALLRLAIQKIVIELGEKGDNLNDDIGKLVEKGKISLAIQQALDVVRVVGNNAVHPGIIDLDDNKSVAANLFGLVNVIVEAAIATPKHIKAMYETVVPESARSAIEKRDKPKQ